MSSRLILQQLIDNNIYDNNAKEILASMVRTVLEEMMNSDFNKTDDQLQLLKYNSTLTLAQKFAETPQIIKTTLNIVDVRGASAPTFDAPIISAVMTNLGSMAGKVVVTFTGINVFEKFFVLTPLSLGVGDETLNLNTNTCGLNYRRDTSSTITISLRELSSTVQNMAIEILIF